MPNGLAVIDLATRAIDKIVDGRVNVVMTGMKTGNIYYLKSGVLFTVNPNTKEVREIGKLPTPDNGGSVGVATVNADETLVAGTITDGRIPPDPNRPPGADSYPSKGAMMEARLAARLPMRMFTLNTKTGEVKTILRATDWLNHLQFSPTDPSMLLFCHEGPWHKVDRTWIIRADGSGLTKVHPRTMNMEIQGHEFLGRRWQDSLVRPANAKEPCLLAFGIQHRDARTGLVPHGT